MLLGRTIDDYTFFSYNVNEALHISARERELVLDCFSKIKYELEHDVDKHSRTLITDNLALLLDYCTRFYDRQFLTRDTANSGLVERLETILTDYFVSGKAQEIGLPSVAYCASQLNFSPNYFGDLVKKQTGKSAHEFIQLKVMDIAKKSMFDTTKSVREIAYALGFKYSQHFNRVFKQYMGVTPLEYRNSKTDGSPVP